MSTMLSRESYEKLIEEDLAWLEKQSQTLEREHIKLVLKASPGHEYEKKPRAFWRDLSEDERAVWTAAYNAYLVTSITDSFPRRDVAMYAIQYAKNMVAEYTKAMR